MFVRMWSLKVVSGGCVAICSHVTYIFVMHKVSERKVLDYIEPVRMKKWIILCESYHDFFCDT